MANLRMALTIAHQWKFLGNECKYFWLVSPQYTHEKLVQLFNEIMRDPTKTSDWLAKGVNYLLPKNSETK